MTEDRFKFRVFITDKKHSKNSLTGMFKVHSLHTGTNKVIITSTYGNVSIKLDNNILMQCTGLKDRNGKLIYEGDIVKKCTFIDYNGNGYQPDVYLDRVDIGVVHFTASNGAVLRKVKTYLTDNPYEEKKLMPKQDQPKAVKLFACRSEVIGNIYENKELNEVEE